ncbi:MAG: hypothetical protein U1E98_04635 [Moraxella osloensis]
MHSRAEVGNSVACQIYDKRSSTCQSVQVGDEQCIKARHHYELSNDIFSQSACLMAL